MQTQSPTPISKWIIDWADAKAAIRSRAGDLPQIAELDRLIVELLDVILAARDELGGTAPDALDFLEVTQEDLAAEDDLWNATTMQYADKLAALAAKIEMSSSLPLMDENGRWLVDDYTKADFQKAAE